MSFSRDILTETLRGLDEGDRVPSSAALRTYDPRKQWWYADRDRKEEGDAQTTKTLHLRSNGSKWHRSYVERHYLAPLVAMAFRIEGYDKTHVHGDDIGVKVNIGHQSTLTGYHIMFKVNGSCAIFEEDRDGADEDLGTYGHTLAKGTWGFKPKRRYQLLVQQDLFGDISVRLDGKTVLHTTDPTPNISGQVGFRLDGVDTTLHSLLIKETA